MITNASYFIQPAVRLQEMHSFGALYMTKVHTQTSPQFPFYTEYFIPVHCRHCKVQGVDVERSRGLSDCYNPFRCLTGCVQKDMKNQLHSISVH